ncbi:MAG TPA: RidA family protein [Deltaproteobacteria bacterium]|nr:RidA family protein [Deltaproteobacteria bacterium]
MQALLTDNAPKAVGPYSQAVCAGGFVFVAGQIPVDPSTGQLVPGGPAEQTRRVLMNIEAILQSSRLTLGHVVRTEVFLADMGDFGAMNDVYAEFFSREPRPARLTAEVSRLPKDALVEISCIAYAG